MSLLRDGGGQEVVLHERIEREPTTFTFGDLPLHGLLTPDGRTVHTYRIGGLGV